MFWQKIGNSVSDRLFRDSVIAEFQCLYLSHFPRQTAQISRFCARAAYLKQGKRNMRITNNNYQHG